MKEVTLYLKMCESDLEIDSFCFDPWINVSVENTDPKTGAVERPAEPSKSAPPAKLPRQYI